MTLDDFLAHFEAVKKASRGWTARCPAHDDRSRNTLGIALGAEGRRLVHCRASCRTSEVLSVVGLHLVDLFEDSERSARPRAPRRPAGAEPTLTEALQEVLREYRRVHYPDYQLATAGAELYRRALHTTTLLRRRATALGDVDAAWTLLADAAALERMAENVVA